MSTFACADARGIFFLAWPLNPSKMHAAQQKSAASRKRAASGFGVVVHLHLQRCMKRQGPRRLERWWTSVGWLFSSEGRFNQQVTLEQL